MTRGITNALLVGSLMVLGAATASAQSLDSFIDAAEATFGGEAYEAGRIGNFAEVQLLSGNQLVEVLYNAQTGQLLDSESFGSPRLVGRVATALDTAVIPLSEAIAAAEQAVGPGEVLEAVLLITRRSSGRAYLVDIRTDSGIFDVIVSSANGQIIRVLRD